MRRSKKKVAELVETVNLSGQMKDACRSESITRNNTNPFSSSVGEDCPIWADRRLQSE